MTNDNDKINIIPEEEMLGESERWFAGIIKYIENESRNDEERLALFSTFNRGFKATINIIYETKGRIEYLKNPLSVYVLGVKESTYIIKDMIDDMLKFIEKEKVPIKEENIKLLFIQVFMKGIELTTELYQRNKLDEDTIKVVENFDDILKLYEGKDPEAIWELIRNRIGVSITF